MYISDFSHIPGHENHRPYCTECKQPHDKLVMFEHSDNVCLTCLRAAVAMLEGQEQLICALCQQPITATDQGYRDSSNDLVHNRCTQSIVYPKKRTTP